MNHISIEVSADKSAVHADISVRLGPTAFTRVSRIAQ
jgi:hypothetical protein